MSIALTINAVDRTLNVEADSLRIDNIITRKRDSCRFNILVNPSSPYTPVIGQQVVITLDGTRVFGGVIVALEQRVTSYKLIRWVVTCEDFTRLLDRKLVPETYQNQTVDQIIADLAATYFPAGFTLTNVNAPVTVKYVAFNYLPVSKCLEDLADMVNYDWYVDENKDLHFFAPGSEVAPVDVEDDNGSHVYDSLTIRKDNSQVRNSIIVRGGQYLGASFTGEWLGNGTDYIVPLPYKFNDFGATLTGNPLSIGIDYINDPNNYHALYNFNEKVLKFPSNRVPTNGATLVYFGKPNLPVIVKLKSSSSASTLSATEGGDGIYEYLIVDKTINSKEGARQRALAEIQTYATTLSEGEFETHYAGFRAGQRVRINSATRGIDEVFIINKVTFEQFDSTSFKYRVSLVTTKTFDLVDLLIDLTLRKNKEIVIDENETVDIVQTFEDAMTIADSLGTFSVSVDGPPYLWDDARWGFSTYL